MVRRHWRIVALVSLLVAGAAWFTGRNAITQYQSTLTVQVESQKQVLGNLSGGNVDELALQTDPIRSEALVLTTQALARDVVRALALNVELADPGRSRSAVLQAVTVDTADVGAGQYTLTRSAGGWRLTDAAGALLSQGGYDERAVGPGFAFAVVPAAEGADTAHLVVTPPEQAAAWVRGGLGYGIRDGTNAVDIYFTGTDPHMVPRVLNQAAVQLREDGARRARDRATHRRAYIEQQLARAEQGYRAKLGEMQRFRETARVTNLTTEQQTLVATIQEIEQDRQLLMVQIATLEATLADSTGGVETLNRLSALDLGNNTALSFQINQLLSLYEERRTLTAGTMGLQESNPQVRSLDQRIDETFGALRAAVGATHRQLQSRLGALDANIERLRRALGQFPGLETTIAQIQLEVRIQEQTTQYLLGQYEAARLQEATIAPYVTILDGASPAYRVGTTLRQKLILGALVGLLLGLGAAFFLEYLDQSIKTSQDVERVLRLPVLGHVPHDPKLASHNGHRQPITLITALSQEDPAAEAYRSLRTNVLFVGAEKPLQVVSITSPGPGEGKSTTAANLAVTLAQNGARTLLVDADLRRPVVHRAFSITQEPGLTDVLIGRASPREAIRPEVTANLDVLPSGALPPNPSELLGSEAMRALLGEIRRDYDWVLIDTPPVLPVTDATVVAAEVDAVILTVRSGETDEAAAERAVEQLRHVGARLAGTVLNALSTTRDRHYTYYAYRRSDAVPAPRTGALGRTLAKFF